MIVAPGTTSFTGYRLTFCDDSGLPLTGKVAADFPDIYYTTGANTAAVKITLSDLALITSGYSSGGITEDTGSMGTYRLDLPDLALATAGRKVKIYGEATGKHVICEAIDVQNVPANVTQLLGTAWLTPAVAGTPDVNAKTLSAGAIASIWNALTSGMATAGSIGKRLVDLFAGMTSLSNWLGALAGKQTPDATALAEINATGAGSGGFDAGTDSLEAVAITAAAGGSDPLANSSSGYSTGEIGYELHEIYRKQFADHKIDRTTSPGWTEVWFDPGTDVEVLRLRLLDIAGNPIRQATTIVAQEVR